MQLSSLPVASPNVQSATRPFLNCSTLDMFEAQKKESHTVPVLGTKNRTTFFFKLGHTNNPISNSSKSTAAQTRTHTFELHEVRSTNFVSFRFDSNLNSSRSKADQVFEARLLHLAPNRSARVCFANLNSSSKLLSGQSGCPVSSLHTFQLNSTHRSRLRTVQIGHAWTAGGFIKA